MGELRVEMAADKEISGKYKKEESSATRVNIFLIASLLAGAAALAASVFYPSSKLVEEVKQLVAVMENITTSSCNNNQNTQGKSYILKTSTFSRGAFFTFLSSSRKLPPRENKTHMPLWRK